MKQKINQKEPTRLNKHALHALDRATFTRIPPFKGPRDKWQRYIRDLKYLRIDYTVFVVCCLLGGFSIPFIIFDLVFCLPRSRNSDPRSRSTLFSPPRFVPWIFIARSFQFFFRSTRVELCLPTLRMRSQQLILLYFCKKIEISPRRDSNSWINTTRSSIRARWSTGATGCLYIRIYIPRSKRYFFYIFHFFLSSGGWLKIKLKLPHFNLSDTRRVSI